MTEEEEKVKKEEQKEEEEEKGKRRKRQIFGVFQFKKVYSRFSHDRCLLRKIKIPLGCPPIGSFRHIISL